MPIDSPFDSLTGIRSPFGRRGLSVPQIITLATGGTAPALGALQDGDTVQSGLAASATDLGNYASTAGTIQAANASVLIEGQSGTLASVVSANDLVSVEITVTDDAGNEQTFNAGTQTVQAPEGVTFATRSGAGSITFEQIATSDLWTAERSGAGSITFTIADVAVTGQRTTTLEA